MTNTSSRFLSRRMALAACAVACASMLAACGESSAENKPEWRNGGIADAGKAFDELSKKGLGFKLGSIGAPRIAYVMFDPKCPHCAALWEAAKPVAEKKEVLFFWVPIGVVNKDSVALAASILDQPDQIAAMNETEKSIMAKQGGFKSETPPSEKAIRAVMSNVEIAITLGLEEVPIIVVKNKAGTPIVSAGGLTTEKLNKLLSL
jgi:thiol:disulfide interchange protein DsbG